MTKIITFHQNQLGDLLFSLPALKAVRDHYQEAIISSVTRPNLSPLLKETSLVDEIILREKGINPFHKIGLIRKLRREKFKMGIFFSQSEELLLLGSLSNIEQRIGFRGKGDFLLTKKVRKEGPSSIFNCLKLIEDMGIEPQKKDYVGLVKVPSSDMEFTRKLLGSFGLLKENRIAVISPFASKRRKNKEWSKEKWAKVLDFLWTKKHLRPLIVGGREEIEEAEKIRELTRVSNPVVLAGKTTILQLAALIKLADIFIGIDSGPTHLASSLKIPVVALFGPTDPLYTGPQAENSLVIKKERMDLIELEALFKIKISHIRSK